MFWHQTSSLKLTKVQLSIFLLTMTCESFNFNQISKYTHLAHLRYFAKRDKVYKYTCFCSLPSPAQCCLILEVVSPHSCSRVLPSRLLLCVSRLGFPAVGWSLPDEFSGQHRASSVMLSLLSTLVISSCVFHTWWSTAVINCCYWFLASCQILS